MVQKIKYATRLNLSRSTDESLKWFKAIQHGTDKFFLQLDIVNMYPSINDKLVKHAIAWAKSLGVDILPAEEKAVLHCRESILLFNSEKWEKATIPNSM